MDLITIIIATASGCIIPWSVACYYAGADAEARRDMVVGLLVMGSCFAVIGAAFLGYHALWHWAASVGFLVLLALWFVPRRWLR